MLLSSGIDGPRVHAINVYVFSARASLVSPLACFLGFSYSLTSRFMVAFTSGRVVGSPCPPRRMRAVASVLSLRPHQVLQVPADVGRGRRQAGATVLKASAGEVVPAGDVGPPGVGGPAARLRPGLGQDVDADR